MDNDKVTNTAPRRLLELFWRSAHLHECPSLRKKRAFPKFQGAKGTCLKSECTKENGLPAVHVSTSLRGKEGKTNIPGCQHRRQPRHSLPEFTLACSTPPPIPEEVPSLCQCVGSYPGRHSFSVNLLRPYNSLHVATFGVMEVETLHLPRAKYITSPNCARVLNLTPFTLNPPTPGALKIRPSTPSILVLHPKRDRIKEIENIQ